MKIGDVFYWEEYSETKIYGKIKPRWFIYFYEAISDNNIVFSFYSTTTSQISRYGPNGDRRSNLKHVFTGAPFDTDCIIDFEFKFFSKKKIELEMLVNDGKIIVKGCLNQSQLKLLYSKVLKSEILSLREKIDIYKYFNANGITDLKEPA